MIVRSKYETVTRYMHVALATSVVIQLVLQAVMRVPPGVGLGKDDWRREAFEVHAHFGPTVVATCLLFWIWISLPPVRPGVARLFPWLNSSGRESLKSESLGLLRLRLPAPHESSALVGTVQGLGLLAVSGTVVAGTVSYLGYYTSVHVSAHILHWSAISLRVLGVFVWLFVVGHVSMALRHWLRGDLRTSAASAPESAGAGS